MYRANISNKNGFLKLNKYNPRPVDAPAAAGELFAEFLQRVKHRIDLGVRQIRADRHGHAS